MRSFTDQTGRSVFITDIPARIVSLVPSQTELLFDLGLEMKVAGITKFCIHPADWLRSKTIIGGTKTVKLNLVHQLQPDLIIANKEENVKEQIEELSKQYPVWISDINTLEDAIAMIREVGHITSTLDNAEKMITEIERAFIELKIEYLKEERTKIQDPKGERTKKQEPKKENDEETGKALPDLSAPGSRFATPVSTCYLIWKDPYMTAGGDTFINDMLLHCGLSNAFGHLPRYPEITISQLQAANPALILLSSEPFPFRQKHIDELQPYFPDAKIIAVDGEMFSWYGSRLLKSPGYFKTLQNKIRQHKAFL